MTIIVCILWGLFFLFDIMRKDGSTRCHPRIEYTADGYYFISTRCKSVTRPFASERVNITPSA